MNLTAEEHFKLHGTVTKEHLEKLFNDAIIVENLDTIAGQILSAEEELVESDFLALEISRLYSLADHLFDKHHAEVMSIISAIEQQVALQVQASDRAKYELNKAFHALKQ